MGDNITDAQDGIRTLDGNSFQSLVINANGRVAVEFMSYGCGYCRAIEPIIQRIAKIIKPDESIFRINVEADPDVATQYAIGGTPTFVTFLDGNEVGRTEGPDPTLTSVMEAVTGPFVQ